MTVLENYLLKNGDSYIKCIAHKSYNNYLKSYSGYIDYEDFYQDCLINLLYDLQNNYNSNRSSITTYIYQRISCYALTQVRNLNAKKRIPVKNVISIHKNYNDDANLSYENILSDNDDGNNIMNIITEVVKQIKDNLNKKIFEMYLIGYTNKEISQCVSLKESVVKSRIHYIKNKFKAGKYKY